MVSNEKILVCLFDEPNGVCLIRRGSRLAHLCHSPLFVLSILPEQEEAETNPEISEDIRQRRSVSEKCQASFISKTCKERHASDVIADTARQLQITQIIIGHPGMTRWQEIWHGSIVNELLKKIEEIDIHIIADSREPE